MAAGGSAEALDAMDAELAEKQDAAAVGEEEEEDAGQVPDPPTYPNMDLAQKAFLLQCDEPPEELEAVRAELMEEIRKDSMAPFYEVLCARHEWPVDSAVLEAMKSANEAELTKLKAAVADAEQNHGETEVLDALFAIAQFQAKIGAKEEAYEAFQVILDKPKVSTGRKIDASMQKLRVALFHMDTEVARKLIEATKKRVEDGGDWDRRNRLKVYEALFLMTERDFRAAAKLLLDGIATFTCTELCSYDTFILYAVVTNLLFLERPELKKKIVEGPEVLGVIPNLEPLPMMVTGLYDCEYGGFFAALVQLNTVLARDRYLARHARYLIREFRILAYSQFLEAYKSVMISTMSRAFGVGDEFLDKELSRFIATSRLNAKIDRVGGMVETNRSDQKNAQYLTVIKKGDLLLNRIQKLARVIDV